MLGFGLVTQHEGKTRVCWWGTGGNFENKLNDKD